MLQTRIGRAYVLIVGALAIVAAIGMIVMWPGETDPALSEVLATDTEIAEVTQVVEYPCEGFATDVCKDAEVELETGPDEGARTTLTGLGITGGPSPPGLGVGDKVRVLKSIQPPGLAPAQDTPEYSLTDFERRAPMLWLALVFGALVVIFGRLRGALSLVGLLVSLGIVLVFIVPAILEGTDPLPVAIIGSLAVMLATIALAHGLGATSIAAMLGTGGSLMLVAVLALAFTNLVHLTGLSSEEATLLAANEAVISFQGLLLAGMVIGALGVIDDVTVSQSSTVMALRAANPALPAGELFSRALHVGRDHVAATVNTLVFAYVGASLPILLVFSSSAIGFFEATNFELVAKEVVATLVGSIGIIAAMPLTTALAAALAARLEPAEAASAEGGHVH